MSILTKTKVLFVASQLGAGGSERIVLELANSLDPSRFEIYIAAFDGGSLEPSLRTVCKEIFFLKKNKGFDFSAVLQLAAFIRSRNIDVLNAHHYMPFFYSFLGGRLLNRKRLIYTEHSVLEVEGIVNSFHGKLLHWMLFDIHSVIGVSVAITKKFKESYPRHIHKFMTILNGVDIEKFSIQQSRSVVRKKWNLTGDHFVVGTIANFRKVKNHACLVRAVARLKDSHPQIRLFLVGTGFQGDDENTEDEIRKLIITLGIQNKVILAGYQDNIPEVLSLFDLFCLPSYSEGMPVSLLEAMAARVPVVGSNVTGINEVIVDHDTGLLFSSNDDMDLSRVIGEFVKDEKFSKKLIEKAYNFVKINHNLSNLYCNYSSVFK